MEKVNYLEHTTKVKYGDGLLEHSQEWQWLIDEIEERFEIKEIDSWEQYLCESAPIREVFGYFVKILEVVLIKYLIINVSCSFGAYG